MIIRLNKAMRLLNIGKETAVEYLNSIPGLELPEDVNFSWKLTDSQFEALQEKFKKEKKILLKSDKKIAKTPQLKILGKIDLNSINQKTRPQKITIKEKSAKNFIEEKTTEQLSKTKKVKVPLSHLVFSKDKIIFSTLKTNYTLSYIGISPSFNEVKTRLGNSYIVELCLDPQNDTFSFVNSRICRQIIDFCKKTAKGQEELRQKGKQRKTKVVEKKINVQSNYSITIPLSKINYSGYRAFVIYKGIKHYRHLTKSETKILKSLDLNTNIPIYINSSTKIFGFENSLSNLHSQHPPKTDRPFVSTKTNINMEQRSTLGVKNIDFFDGYYLVWIIKDEKKDPSINPLKIYDKNSLSCLKLIHKYLYDRFPKDIEIIYNSERVLSLSHKYTLGKYIKILYDNIEEYGEWWEEVQNERKPSLPTCRKISQQQIRRIISLKNCYLDYLSGIPNQRNIIKVYEVRQNQQEDVFIFSVQLKNGQIAVIFENVSFVATATWVFIVDEENYEENINRIFDYFTNYKIHNKRQSLTKKANPPEKFKAVDYHKIMHDEPQGWMRRLNDILNREIATNRILFNQGLHISEESISRSSSPEEIKTKHIHNELMRRLYDYLSEQYGEENVGTENRIGTKKIDVVVKIPNGFNIYEIKSDPEPRNCIREAMGQILDYAYFECEDTIHQMTIVGKTPETKEVNAYLKTFRNEKSLEIYYMSI